MSCVLMTWTDVFRSEVEKTHMKMKPCQHLSAFANFCQLLCCQLENLLKSNLTCSALCLLSPVSVMLSALCSRDQANQTRCCLLPIPSSCKQYCTLRQLTRWPACHTPPSSTTTPASTASLGSSTLGPFSPPHLIRPLLEWWEAPMSKTGPFFSPGWTRPTQEGQLHSTITGSYNHALKQK